jgi:hypothetical protein
LSHKDHELVKPLHVRFDHLLKQTIVILNDGRQQVMVVSQVEFRRDYSGQYDKN